MFSLSSLSLSHGYILILYKTLSVNDNLLRKESRKKIECV